MVDSISLNLCWYHHTVNSAGASNNAKLRTNEKGTDFLHYMTMCRLPVTTCSFGRNGCHGEASSWQTNWQAHRLFHILQHFFNRTIVLLHETVQASYNSKGDCSKGDCSKGDSKAIRCPTCWHGSDSKCYAQPTCGNWLSFTS